MDKGTRRCKRCGEPVARRNPTGPLPHYCSYACKRAVHTEVGRLKKAAARTCEACGCTSEEKRGSWRRWCPDCVPRHEKRVHHGPKPCGWCGETFQPVETSVYCGAVCRDRARRKQGHVAECAWCHEEFIANPDRRFYCSGSCRAHAIWKRRVAEGKVPAPRAPRTYGKRAWRVWYPVCAVCGRLFATRHSHARVCSEPCRTKADRKGGPRVAITCEECGTVTEPPEFGPVRRRYCSTRCQKRAGSRRDKWKREQRIRSGVREDVELGVVASRDGWRCHICNLKVTRQTWSLDHLVPLSLGGDHTYTNVRLAHRICNGRRGVDRLPAQLLLIG